MSKVRTAATKQRQSLIRDDIRGHIRVYEAKAKANLGSYGTLEQTATLVVELCKAIRGNLSAGRIGRAFALYTGGNPVFNRLDRALEGLATDGPWLDRTERRARRIADDKREPEVIRELAESAVSKCQSMRSDLGAGLDGAHLASMIEETLGTINELRMAGDAEAGRKVALARKRGANANRERKENRQREWLRQIQQAKEHDPDFKSLSELCKRVARKSNQAHWRTIYDAVRPDIK